MIITDYHHTPTARRTQRSDFLQMAKKIEFELAVLVIAYHAEDNENNARPNS